MQPELDANLEACYEKWAELTRYYLPALEEPLMATIQELEEII